MHLVRCQVVIGNERIVEVQCLLIIDVNSSMLQMTIAILVS